VNAGVYVSKYSDHHSSAFDNDTFVARICFWHNEMRWPRTRFAVPSNLGTRAVRVALSTEEVQRATHLDLDDKDELYVYADIFERDMTIRMHCGLFRDHARA